MTVTPHSIAPRSTDRLPSSDLGSFEIVRRLPVTTWALRPHAHLPHIDPCHETAHAVLAVGRLAGWVDAADWRAAAKARLLLRHSLGDHAPPIRTTQAWLGAATSGESGVAHVPAPPAWLATIMPQWERTVRECAHGTVEDCTTLHRQLCGASWTIWLFALLQPYGDSSLAVAHSHAARMVSSAAATAVSMVAGIPTCAESHAEHRQLLGGALDRERFTAWHRFWLRLVADEAQQVLALLLRLDAARAQLLRAAEAMRAPRHCLLLAHTLVERPQTTVSDASRTLDITFRAAQAIIEKFASHGLLREVTGRKRDRVFACDALSDPMLPWSQPSSPQ